jgi:GNAT superfamily N-acetyltransferase
MDFNEGCVTQAVSVCAEREHPNMCGWVSEHAGVLNGVMAGSVFPHFFGTDLIASDLCLYTDPTSRRSGLVAALLLKAFETWAEAQGASKIILGVSTGIEVDRTTTLYERLGYTMVGPIMQKDFNRVLS